MSRVLVLYLTLCAAGAASVARGAGSFDQKVSLLLDLEPTNPKCFAEVWTDFTCFWLEDEERSSVDQYTFTYNYRNENSSRCSLSAVTAGGNKLLLCQLSRPLMFVQMFIRVHREGRLMFNRSVLIDQLFLLDPPANVSVSGTGQPGQLRVSWLPPALKYMDDSMMYEVSYAAADRPAGQVETVLASTELTLRGLRPGTRYRLRVRVSLDGITYSGYWSPWSDPVLVETPAAELDPLIIYLTLIISFVLLVLSVTMFLSHHRFLRRKIWPNIPTPDSRFLGLFTDHGGDFKEWLRQSSGGLWLTPPYPFSDECPSPLDVLSELSLCSSLPSPPPPPKASGTEDRSKGVDVGRPLDRGDSGLAEDWRPPPAEAWLMARLRALPQHQAPRSQSSLLESQDAYVTLSPNHGRHPDDPLGEALPLEVLFASRKTAPSESHSDLGSVQQSSGSRSSLEGPTHSWVPKGPGYAYMAVADSGVSMDYSPMSRADGAGDAPIYANDVPAVCRPVLQRQRAVHDDG